MVDLRAVVKYEIGKKQVTVLNGGKISTGLGLVFPPTIIKFSSLKLSITSTYTFGECFWNFLNIFFSTNFDYAFFYYPLSRSVKQS